MENKIIHNKKIRFSFNVDGHEFELNEHGLLELKKIVDDYANELVTPKKQLPMSMMEWSNSLNTNSTTIHKIFDNLSLNDVKKNSKSPPIPSAFRQVFESECDPKSPYESTFTYYKDPLDNWGFQISNRSADKSSFSTLGKIEDPDSPIGEFYSKIPMEKSFIKKQFLSLGSRRVTEGRRLKACVDILVYTNKLIKEINVETKTITYKKAYKDPNTQYKQ